MADELSKIDMIRDRMGISYREAKEILDEAEGDLVKALIMAEEKRDRGWGDRVLKTGEEVVGQVKKYINQGNKTRVKVKKGDKTLAEFPASVGVLGIAAALASTELALVAGIGAVAALAKNVFMEIEKPDGETKVISLNRKREDKQETRE